MSQVTEGSRGAHTLLVVDDEPTNLAVLTQVLQPHFRVRAANGGEAALRVASRAPHPDLILLDVMMPDLDGYAVISRLRADARTREIPVIFVTALGDDADEARALELGAADFLTKPIRPGVVLARVRAHLALREAKDRLRDHNHWLEAEVNRRIRDTVLIQDVSLSVLAGLVESRDLETGSHALRSQAYVDVLGRRIQRHSRAYADLTDSALAQMVKAASMHDIGKIGIPDAILLKPGPLTVAEFDVMKTHARIGGEAITRAIARVLALHPDQVVSQGVLEFLETARDMAQWHHERWNGGGYPDGLSGVAIPISARLMAVADVFDAVTTRRVYKPAQSVAQAARILEEGSGSAFDPDVIEAFSASLDDFTSIIGLYSGAPS